MNSAWPQVLPPAEILDDAAFAPFGWVLRRDPSGDLFQPLFKDTESQGWRVAWLDIPAGPLGRLHRHPDSEECFAPTRGHPCVAVATAEAPDRIRLFRVDVPICIRRNVWHEFVSPDDASVFIAENALISGEPRYPSTPIPWPESIP